MPQLQYFNFKETLCLQNGAWGIGPLMKWVATNYNNPDILITENGFQNRDTGYNDDGRIFYIKVMISVSLNYLGMINVLELNNFLR